MAKTLKEGRKAGSGRPAGATSTRRNSAEAHLLTTLPAGKSFFTEKSDKDMTAIANYYKVKIRTERLVAVNTKTETAIKLIKVTIVERGKKEKDNNPGFWRTAAKTSVGFPRNC